MISLLDEVREKLPWLTDECGFEVTFHSCSAASFGDSLVLLRSEDLLLRIIRERGLFFAELTTPEWPEGWWDFSNLSNALRKAIPEPTLESLGLLLKNALPELKEAAGPLRAETEEALQTFYAARHLAILSAAKRKHL